MPQPAEKTSHATTSQGDELRQNLLGGGRQEDFKDIIFAIAKQLYKVKMFHRSQKNPEKFLYNIALLAQLPC